MVNLDPIDFKIGFYIEVNVYDRQKKIEVHISDHLAKIAINWHRIGQMPLLHANINGHNSVIFIQIRRFF